MRKVIIDMRIAIEDNAFDLLEFLNYELAAFENVYLDFTIFTGVDVCVSFAIVNEGVELHLHALDYFLDDVCLVFLLQQDLTALLVQIAKCCVELLDVQWKLEVDREVAKQFQIETSVFLTNLELVRVVEVQTEEEDEGFEDVVFLTMADSLAQEVKHSQIKIVLFDFPITDLEIMEERNDEVDQWLFVVEVEVVGICIDQGDNFSQRFLSGEGEFATVAFFIQHLPELLFEDVNVLADAVLKQVEESFVATQLLAQFFQFQQELLVLWGVFKVMVKFIEELVTEVEIIEKASLIF
jgi:hypothetical protein